MKRRDIIIFSFRNGSATGFKKSFYSSFDPPSKGDIVALGVAGEPRGTLKQGVVRSVRETEMFDEIRVGTEDASVQELRECLIPDGWEEILDDRE